MVIETVTGVLDVKDMTLGQITRDFLGRWKLTEDDDDDDNDDDGAVLYAAVLL